MEEENKESYEAGIFKQVQEILTNFEERLIKVTQEIKTIKEEVQKNSNDIERIEDNFKLLADQK